MEKKTREALTYFHPHIRRYSSLALARQPELLVALHAAVVKKEVTMQELRALGAVYVKLNPEQQAQHHIKLQEAEQIAKEHGLSVALEQLTKYGFSQKPDIRKLATARDVQEALAFFKKSIPRYSRVLARFPQSLWSAYTACRSDLAILASLKKAGGAYFKLTPEQKENEHKVMQVAHELIIKTIRGEFKEAEPFDDIETHAIYVAETQESERKKLEEHLPRDVLEKIKEIHWSLGYSEHFGIKTSRSGPTIFEEIARRLPEKPLPEEVRKAWQETFRAIVERAATDEIPEEQHRQVCNGVISLSHLDRTEQFVEVDLAYLDSLRKAQAVHLEKEHLPPQRLKQIIINHGLVPKTRTIIKSRGKTGKEMLNLANQLREKLDPAHFAVNTVSPHTIIEITTLSPQALEFIAQMHK